VRILSAESLRFPEEGSSAQGQSGPNARPKGVADGHPANIPELPGTRYHDGGTQEATRAWRGRPQGWRQVEACREIRQANPAGRQSWGAGARPQGRKVADATLPRKASKECSGYPYRKPTQVGEEKILRREWEHPFRNSAKWPRNFGRRGAPVAWRGSPAEREGVAVKRPRRLFTKNTGLCEVEYDV